MANRFDWNALNDKIELAQSTFDDIKKRSDGLSVVAMAAILEIDEEEAIDSITDGPNDRGVDALYVDDRGGANNVHMFQTKCVGDFSKSKNNFPGSEVDKLISVVNDLLNENRKALKDANTQLRRKMEDAFQAITKSNATVTIHFVGNLSALPSGEQERLEAAFAKYKAVQFLMHDLDSLSDFFIDKKVPRIDREINVVDDNFFSRSDRDLKGYVCTVSGEAIVDLIRSRENPTIVDDRIFDQNVRVYLKKSNRINRKIIDTALSENSHTFWYRNNGITVTCDSYEPAPTRRSPAVMLRNVQIVNGGQTSNCLFEASKRNDENFSDVLVLMRVIETTSEEVKYSFAEATNSQTPINVRDLKANDRILRQLEEAFADNGYYFERKKSQYQGQPKDHRFDALDCSQAYLAYGLGLPEVAKKDRGRIFGDLYEQVFDDDISYIKLKTSKELIDLIAGRKAVVRSKIREEKKLAPGEMSLIDGAFHVLFCVKQLAIKKSIDLWDVVALRPLIDDAIKIVSELYVEEQAKDENFSSNRFFKDMKTKDQITLKVG